VQTNDDGTLCAQALLNDKSVQAVSLGSVAIGEAEFIAATKDNKRVPVIATGAPADTSAFKLPAYFYLTSANFSTAPDIFWTDHVKAKSVSAIWDSATGAVLADQYGKTLEDIGITAKTVLIPANSTDVVAPLLASKAGETDALTTAVFGPAQCIAVVKALKQLRLAEKPTLAFGSCFDPAVKKALGDYPKWIQQLQSKDINIPDDTGQAGATIFAVQKLRGASWHTDLQSFGGIPPFASILTLARVMNDVGADHINYDSLVAGMRRFNGPLWMGPEKISFNNPAAPSIGSFASTFSRYEGNGKSKYITPFIGELKP
jgi:hypothetical protein